MVVDDEVGTDLRNKLGRHVGIQPPSISERNNKKTWWDHDEECQTITIEQNFQHVSPQWNDHQFDWIKTFWKVWCVWTLNRHSESRDAYDKNEYVNHGPFCKPIQPKENWSSFWYRKPCRWHKPKYQCEKQLRVRPDSREDHDEYCQFFSASLPNLNCWSSHGEFKEIFNFKSLPRNFCFNIYCSSLQVEKSRWEDISSHLERNNPVNYHLPAIGAHWERTQHSVTERLAFHIEWGKEYPYFGTVMLCSRLDSPQPDPHRFVCVLVSSVGAREALSTISYAFDGRQIWQLL